MVVFEKRDVYLHLKPYTIYKHDNFMWYLTHMHMFYESVKIKFMLVPLFTVLLYIMILYR